MKRALLVVSLILGVAGFSGCASKPVAAKAAKPAPAAVAVKPASTNVLVDEKSKASYAIGMVFGHNLEQQGIEVDETQVARGLKDLLAGGALQLTPAEAQAAITNYQAQLIAEATVKNRAEGQIFLLTNKNSPGVITLPDGLQYKVIASGTGAVPAAGSIVTVNYRGTFINGKEFDNSARLGHAAQIPVDQIPLAGWREALAKMNVGAKWQLFIPSELAYGAAGRPPIVPPNATLLLEVELLDVQNPAAPAPAPAPAPPLTSDIIAVPSAEEIKKGQKPYVIKPEDVEKMQSQNRTN